MLERISDDSLPTGSRLPSEDSLVQEWAGEGEAIDGETRQ
jgi:hypothetical protein